MVEAGRWIRAGHLHKQHFVFVEPEARNQLCTGGFDGFRVAGEIDLVDSLFYFLNDCTGGQLCFLALPYNEMVGWWSDLGFLLGPYVFISAMIDDRIPFLIPLIPLGA